MNNGFIKLDRKIINWGWYQDANTFRVFIHLLLTANYKDLEYRGHIIKRGSLVTGRKKLSNQVKLTEQEVRTALNHLISTNEITITTTSKFSIITIKNYNKYQKLTSKATKNQPASNQQATNRATTSKEYIKNIKEERMKEEASNIHSNDDFSFLDKYEEYDDKVKLIGGTLGQGVLMLSDKQDAYLLDYLSWDEYHKYVGIVVEQELKGNHYKNKTHFQAILEMAEKDRRLKR